MFYLWLDYPNAKKKVDENVNNKTIIQVFHLKKKVVLINGQKDILDVIMLSQNYGDILKHIILSPFLNNKGNISLKISI